VGPTSLSTRRRMAPAAATGLAGQRHADQPPMLVPTQSRVCIGACACSCAAASACRRVLRHW
jgi:hypothetical protein